jgi:predicted branched-subunit amino acid permease
MIGFFARKTSFQLTAAILYAVAAVLFFLYAIFLIPSIILGFIGYSVQKKLNKSST